MREVADRFQVAGQGLIDELYDLGFRPMVFERGFDGRNRDARRMNDADADGHGFGRILYKTMTYENENNKRGILVKTEFHDKSGAGIHT